MPEKFTCLGQNVNPPLHIEQVPALAKSLVLIFEDTDATPKVWTHWMLFDIPPATREIEENSVPNGAVEGLANNHSFGYEGPCPRYFKGTHHYRFCLYALNKLLHLPPATEREEVEEKMKAHIIAEAQLSVLCSADALISEEPGISIP